MTYRAVGVPELVELLRMPHVRDQPIATAADLADVLEQAAVGRWQTLASSGGRPPAPDTGG